MGGIPGNFGGNGAEGINVDLAGNYVGASSGYDFNPNRASIVAIDPQQSDILIAGEISYVPSGSTSGAIFAFNGTTGAFDTGFAGSGEAPIVDPEASITGNPSAVEAIACGANGIYAAMVNTYNAVEYVTELTLSGSLSAGFGNESPFAVAGSPGWIESQNVPAGSYLASSLLATVLENGDVMIGAFTDEDTTNFIDSILFWRISATGGETTWDGDGQMWFDASSPPWTFSPSLSASVNPVDGDLVVDTSTAVIGGATWISGSSGDQETLVTPWFYVAGNGYYGSELDTILFNDSGSVISTGYDNTPFLCIYNYGPDANTTFATQSGSTLDIYLGKLGTPDTITVSSSSNPSLGNVVVVDRDGDAPVFSGVTNIVVTETQANDTLAFDNGFSSVPFTFDNCGTSTLHVESGLLSFASVASNSITLGAISIDNGGEAQLAETSSPDSTTLYVASLSIASNGVLDVADNQIILSYGSGPDPFTTIASYIKSGYNSGAWNGPGIISSSAQTPTNGLRYGLGYADGTDGVVAGLSSGEIEVMYTLLGDANLDGLVNAADFTILAANFNQTVTSWDKGDFNYDGLVNAANFTDLAANFNQAVSGAAMAFSAAVLAVPTAPAVVSAPATVGTVNTKSSATASTASKSKAAKVSRAVVTDTKSRKSKASAVTTYAASVGTIPASGPTATPHSINNKDAKFLADR